MRPEKLTPIFNNISSIKGIGPKSQKLFRNIIGEKLIGLLWHLPYNIIKRKKHENILDAKINSIVTLKIKINKHNPSRFKRQPYRVNCICGNIPIDIVYFYARHPYIKSILPQDEERYISGKLEYYNNKYQITHPSHVIKTENINEIKDIEPIYALTSGLTHKIYSKASNQALERIPDLDEWINIDTLKKFSFSSWKQSLLSIHNPKNENDLLKTNINRRRLAYDELLAHQLSIAIIRNFNQKQKGLVFIKNPELLDKLINNLPFDLTNSQINAWDEIYKDLISTNQMIRLLQGDVGSGKTIISILGMLHAIESNYQVAMMAPTTILANQHYENIKDLLSPFDISITILTSKDKGIKKKEKIKLIKEGKVNIVIGTHSLIQEDVEFNSIGLVIIDEQHKFGVFQRMAFTNKGRKPSLLVMSATPIPRTLSLAAYGDMDQTLITEKPHGRLPIITTSLEINKSDELIEKLIKNLSKDKKAYWVCPLIEESEESDLKAVTERYKILNKKIKGKILLLHGRIKDDEKEIIMNKFIKEDYRILVTTTVIEVGIDIKETNTLIIEHAERFGLAQLHQLRGRIGRNNLQSNCILLYKNPLSQNAKERLKIMKKTENGFEIAEKDLQIRGAGEILGKRQSGLPSFLIADLSFDNDLLEDVRKKISEISKIDPILKTKNGENLKTLLYLFEKDTAIKTLKAG